MKISKKIVKLFLNRGFYILLALGVGIVCVSGYVVNLKNKQSFEMPVSETINVPEPTPKLSSIPALSEEKETKITPAPKAVAAAATEEPKSGKLMLPIQGELGTGFSGNDLVYSPTMGDWRVHSGIDIRGDVGTQVKAAADGIITKVYADDMMGTTVVIQHANGIETLYSNLQSGIVVDEDQEVKRGDVIGGVGMTGAYEISEPPHLHFEVKKDGEFVNPFDYIDY